MAVVIDNANWVQVLDKHTDCILVKRGNEWHVRQYQYKVSNGMPRYKAMFWCGYRNLPLEMAALVPVPHGM